MVIRNKKVHKIWVFESGYRTIQHCDGSTSCDCVPWSRRKTCRHTRMIELDTIDFNTVTSEEYDPLTLVDLSTLSNTAWPDMRGLPRGAPSPSQVSPPPETPTDTRPERSLRKFNFSIA